jgi:cell division protein FtsZ
MGMALMGTGVSSGEHRAVEAAQRAISSPLLEEASIEGAKGVLINITGGRDMTLFEVHEAASIIQEAADEEANIIFGTVIDDALGDEVKVTVIAAGFEGGQPPRRQPGIARAADLRNQNGRATAPPQAAPAPTAAPASAPQPAPVGAGPGSAAPRPAPQPTPQPAPRPSRPADDDDDLDVPDFMK